MKLLLGVSVSLIVAPSLAEATVIKYAVLVGNNQGHAHEVELLYAGSDAQRIGDVLERLGGFRPENVTILAERSPADLRSALITLNDRIRRDVQDGHDEVLLFVYYSGHADADKLHLGREDLPIDELRRLVRGSAATFRVLVLDSCKSGALTRVKGGRPAPSFDIAMEETLATEGSVFITSSAADEDSQETDKLGASFFSHYFTSGLLGAADTSGDGKVSLAEVYGYAHEQTVKSTSQTWAGTQHPTFQYDLKGKGDVVLTDLALDSPRKAALLFPEPGDYLVLRGGSRGAVVAEVRATRAQARLIVEPGTYFLRVRGQDMLLEGIVRVTPGEELGVDTEPFERIRYARLVRKGEGIRDSSHGPLVIYRFRGEILSGLGPMHMVGVGYPTSLPWFTVTPRLAYGQSRAENEVLRSTTHQLDLSVAATRAFDWWRFSAAAGLEVGGTYVAQRFQTSGRAPSRDALGFIFGGIGTLSVDLAWGMYAEGSAEILTYVVRQGASPRSGSTMTPLTYALGLGVGKNF